MKVRELIERLQQIENIIKGSPHPNTDDVKFIIHFGDAELDDRCWDVEIDEITHNNRPFCGCEEHAIIALAIKEIV